jgi:hypothetical protein
MTCTIQCPECGVVLNVPDSAAGRKLKCPKCATKFAAPKSFGPDDSVIADSPSPNSTMFPTRKDPKSQVSGDMPTRRPSSGSIDLPVSSGRPASGDLFDLPSTPAPLRDTFDLPLLADDLPLLVDETPKGSPQKKAPADVLALFQDEPKSNRKVTGAEARSKARRCPSCGGVVGIGMSLCNTCGLDLDTGQRITPLEVFDEEIPAFHRSDTPPLGIMFVGSIAALANVLLTVISLTAWANGKGIGFLCLLIIWIFGIYAAVQFLRQKAIRPLFLALGLAVSVGVVYLIVLPIVDVNFAAEIPIANDPDAPPPNVDGIDPNDPDAPAVRNMAEQLNVSRIFLGIAALLSYAAVSIYLNTPGIKRQFHKP